MDDAVVDPAAGLGLGISLFDADADLGDDKLGLVGVGRKMAPREEKKRAKRKRAEEEASATASATTTASKPPKQPRKLGGEFACAGGAVCGKGAAEGECGKSYGSALSLTRHQNPVQFPCPEGCGEEFSSRSYANKHAEMHAQPGGCYPCVVENCSKTFKSEYSLQRHQEMHAQPGGCYPCVVENCGKTFESESGLQGHQEMHAQPGGCYSCDVDDCDKTFTSEYGLQRHQEMHAQPGGCYPCVVENCSKTFKSEYSLQRHQEMHAQPGGCYPCVVENCGKTFESESGLQGHQEMHAQPGGCYSCDVDDCDKTFTSELGLHGHQEMHAQPGGCYSCLICLRQYRTKLGRDLHQHWCGEPETGYHCQWDGADCPTTFVYEAARNPTLTKRRLCAHHSELEYIEAGEPWPGLPSANYCAKCAEDGVTRIASFDGPTDELGRAMPRQLCAQHAVLFGTHCSSRCGSSHAADQGLHLLEARLQAEGEDVYLAEHVCFGQPGDEVSGRELSVLENKRITVDGVFRYKATEQVAGLAQYQGNYFHGYPELHELHETFVSAHRWGPTMLNHTRLRNLDYMSKPTYDGATPIEVPLYELQECDVKAYTSGQTEELEYTVYERNVGITAEAIGAMMCDESGEPAGEHTSREQRVLLRLPPGCGLCREAKDAAKAAAAATSTAAAAATSTAAA